MKMIAPNIAMPIVKPIAFATSKTRERKSASGRIGSAARRSRQTNSASSTTPTTPSPTIVGEPHAYSLPPQVVSRISALTPRGQQRGAEAVDAVRASCGVCRCSRRRDDQRPRARRPAG